MRKIDLVETIVKNLNGKISKKTVWLIVNELFDTIKQSLERGEEVKVLPFGIFKIIEKKEKKVRNPKTGEILNLPLKKIIKFKPGKKLRKILI